MGIYDRFDMPTSERYISTYAGAPIAETAALGEVIGQRYDRGMQGISAYNVMRNNASVLEADEEMKNKVFDESYEGLKEYAERGDYENAYPAIINATTMVSGDKKLKKAMANKQAMGEFQTTVEKMHVDGDIEEWQKDLALQRAAQYGGVESGNMSQFLRTPSESVDFRSQMEDAAQKVRPHSIEGEPVWNPNLGKYEVKTTKSYRQDELDAAMTAILSDPKTSAYLQDLAEAKGGAYVLELMDNNKKAVSAGMQGWDESTQYIAPGKGYGPGGSGGAGAPGGMGNTTGYEQVTATGQEEGKDYVQVGKDLELADGSFWSPDMSMEERAALREKNDQRGGTWGRIAGGISNWWNDTPSEEDMAEYGKISEATRRMTGKTEEDWAKMDTEEKDQMIGDFMQHEGQRMNHLNIEDFDVVEEKRSNHVTGNAVTQDKMRTAIQKDLEANYGTRAYYNVDGGEQTSLKDDDTLRKAMAGEDDYSYVVKGSSSNRTPHSGDNESFASSYVMEVTDDEGETTNYLVSKDPGYMNRPHPTANATNKDYNQTVSEIYNAFPVTEYEDTFKKGTLEFDGRRQGERPDGSEGITARNIKVEGKILSDNDLRSLAQGYSHMGVTYNEETGEINNLTEEMLTAWVYAQ